MEYFASYVYNFEVLYICNIILIIELIYLKSWENK